MILRSYGETFQQNWILNIKNLEILYRKVSDTTGAHKKSSWHTVLERHNFRQAGLYRQTNPATKNVYVLKEKNNLLIWNHYFNF